MQRKVNIYCLIFFCIVVTLVLDFFGRSSYCVIVRKKCYKVGFISILLSGIDICLIFIFLSVPGFGSTDIDEYQTIVGTGAIDISVILMIAWFIDSKGSLFEIAFC